MLKSVFLIFGLLLVLIAFYAHYESKEVMGWTETTGIFQDVYARRIPSRKWEEAKDIVDVKYTYTVKGEKFSGERLAILQHFFIARSQIENLMPGPISVYYNPESFDESVVIRDYPLTAVLTLLFFGLACISVGVFYKAVFGFIYKIVLDLK